MNESTKADYDEKNERKDLYVLQSKRVRTEKLE
jgi:hypothetical protein